MKSTRNPAAVHSPEHSPEHSSEHAPQQPSAHASAHSSDLHRQFHEALGAALATGDVVRLSLSKYHGAEPDLRRVLGRLVTLKGASQLSLVYRYKTRDVTKNFNLKAGATEIMSRIDAGFHHAHLTTGSEDIQLATNRRGDFRMQRGRLNATAESRADEGAHDRAKRRHLELDRPFLSRLGISNEKAQLVPSMAGKWKQVNKFLEILDHAIESAGLVGRESLRVVDFGAGKGYLTFAVHDYLTHVRGMAASVTGVELRPELVTLCNEVAASVGAEGLAFEAGSIHEHVAGPAGKPAADRIDVLIALHACDVATDEAMNLGVRAGASVIMCSPCCHKELRPQMHSPLALRPMLKHGIHLGQEAEMVTDSLRALLLESEGYETQVFEFVSLEHTSKNKMILAVRKSAAPARDDVLAQVREIKSFYGIREQRLESLLQAGANPSP